MDAILLVGQGTWHNRGGAVASAQVITVVVQRL